MTKPTVGTEAGAAWAPSASPAPSPRASHPAASAQPVQGRTRSNRRSSFLTVAAAQPELRSLDVSKNIEAHAAAVIEAKARLVVFPELSLTGYELDAPALAPEDPRLALLLAACADANAVALVGAPVTTKDGGAPFIATLRLDAAGAYIAYRKMYLGNEEARRFRPGPQPSVIEVDGWRLGLGICKDTGVSEHARSTAALGIDVYIAGTVKHAGEAKLQAQRAEAIAREHGVWVVVSSFAGSTGGGFTQAAGHSGIWAPGGTPIVVAGPDVGHWARAELGDVLQAKRDEKADFWRFG